MMHAARYLMAFALCLILSGPGALANWGGWAEGCLGSGDFQAIGAGQVVLADENLEIELYSDRAKVRVDYVFVNTGAQVNVIAGFPCAVFEGESGEPEDFLEIEDYRILVGGQAISYDVRPGSEVKGTWVPKDLADRLGEEQDFPASLYWFVSVVPFNRGESRAVRIEYESRYECTFGGVSNETVYDDNLFHYLLSTGSVWKGPIKSGKITIRPRTVAPGAIQITPAGRFKRNGADYIWTFRDLEPTAEDDIMVTLNDGMVVYPIDNTPEYCWYSQIGEWYYLDSHDFSAKASSMLQGKSSYKALNVRDYDAQTAWVEGVQGDGVGESLILTLDRPAANVQLGIINGYAKSRAIYYANNRVAELKIAVNGGPPFYRTLYDDFNHYDPRTPKAYQFIRLDDQKTPIKTIQLTIARVYKGTKYDDTGITEIILHRRLDKQPAIQGAR